MGDYSSGGTVGSISIRGVSSMRAPEIDPAGATTALTMLACGIAIMRSGRNGK